VAVGAKDPQVLQPIIPRIAVDMVELQRKATIVGDRRPAALLTVTRLDLGGEEPQF